MLCFGFREKIGFFCFFLLKCNLNHFILSKEYFIPYIIYFFMGHPEKKHKIIEQIYSLKYSKPNYNRALLVFESSSICFYLQNGGSRFGSFLSLSACCSQWQVCLVLWWLCLATGVWKVCFLYSSLKAWLEGNQTWTKKRKTAEQRRPGSPPTRHPSIGGLLKWCSVSLHDKRT